MKNILLKIGENFSFSHFLVPESVSPLHVQNKVCMAPFHVQSKVCIASFYVRSKDWKFAPHLEGSHADFAPHMDGSHADFAPHMERRHSLRDQQIAKIYMIHVTTFVNENILRESTFKYVLLFVTINMISKTLIY